MYFSSFYFNFMYCKKGLMLWKTRDISWLHTVQLLFLYNCKFVTCMIIYTFTWWPYCLYETSQDMYKKAAEFWAELRVELLSASAFLNDKPNTSQLWRLYWASHQVLIFKWCLKTQSLFWCVTCPYTKYVLGSVAFL